MTAAPTDPHRGGESADPAVLVLAGGRSWRVRSCGAQGGAFAEAVAATGMTVPRGTPRVTAVQRLTAAVPGIEATQAGGHRLRSLQSWGTVIRPGRSS